MKQRILRSIIALFFFILFISLITSCSEQEPIADFDFTEVKEGKERIGEIRAQEYAELLESSDSIDCNNHSAAVGYDSTADGQSHYQRCAICKEIMSESEPCAFDERDFDYLLKYNDYRLLFRKCPNCGAMEVLVTTKSITQLAAMGIRVETR